ncbi:MAG TPA: S8 family serine peptidase [Pseudonocardiaceae bacterium]
MRRVRARSIHRPAVLVVGLIAGLVLATAAAPRPAEGAIIGEDNPNAIPGRYLVTFADDVPNGVPVPELAARLAAEHDATVSHTYSHTIRGFAAGMDESAARRLAAHPSVARVERDTAVASSATQSPTPSWALDRVDQAALPLDNRYTYPDSAGSGVTVYVIDTGIRVTHADFGGRAVWGSNSSGDGVTGDCNGHGTHVAGTIGGGTYGVAKAARLVAVKVLGCTGSGTTAGITAGVDWVTANHQAGAPAVANLSVNGTGANTTLEAAVRASIADGVVYAVAAGNSNQDACNTSPARVAEAITVAATTNTDARASFSNYGSCVDIFAPGQNITSVWGTGDTATNTMSGTSVATPHVAGAAALVLSEAPGLTAAHVALTLFADATAGRVSGANAASADASVTASPNRLLRVRSGGPTRNNVRYWNDVLLETIRRQGGGPGPLARGAAMMHAGLFDAVNSATLSRRGSTPYDSYLTLQTVHQSVNENLVAGFVARDLLVAAFPQQQAFVDQKFAERYGTSTQAVARQLADTVVAAMTTARTGDGSAGGTAYTPQNVPGAWRPTDGCTAVDPHWGAVVPFTMTSGSQFRRPALAPDLATLLGSSTYATVLADVRSLGRNNSTTRTADQTRAAWFWANDLDGTYKPPGQLLAHTALVADGRVDDGLRLSRLFALVSLALADAGIAAWDMKYRTSIDLWRPETAVKQDATNPDPTWEPLSADRNSVSFSPCFPAWVSGHATLAGAWAGVMRTEFGDAVTFTATTDDPHAVGVTRTFTSFTAAATENARSRVWLGVHFQFDADDGLATGYDIATHVHATTLRPRP